MQKNCSQLAENESIVFKIHSDIHHRKVFECGHVVRVNLESQTVCVIYLEGYKSRTADVSYNDMVAVYHPEGEFMRFENISGRSCLLCPN